MKDRREEILQEKEMQALAVAWTGHSFQSIPNHSPIGFDRSVFSGHASPIINQGSGTVHNITNNQLTSDRKGMDLLLRAIAPGAFHNSEERYDPPKCHPSTRVAILRKIRLWVEELKKTRDFVWLHGSAGSGKSAIAQTIAELCEKLNLLAATFFFSRTALGRGDVKQLVPTLVYQLCQSMPEIRSYVEDVIEKDPLVVSRSVEAQFKGLIIEPLERALMDPLNATLLSRPRLIIIDGLDECAGRDVQSNLLRVLSTSVKALPVRLFFMIASRPEPHIRHAFSSSAMAPMTMPLVLDESYLPSDDIEIFLLAKFEEVKESHPLSSFLDPTWPTQSEISSLVDKASGQFIYASTVIKYVNSPRHRPVDRLKVILGILTPPSKDTPFAALDALYSFIFSCVDDLEATLRVLSLLIFSQPSEYYERTPELIEDLLCLQRGDTHIILQDLHSLVDIPLPKTHGQLSSREVRILHASLGDFLQDETRSGQFYLDTGRAHADLARSVLKHIPRGTPTTSLLISSTDWMKLQLPPLFCWLQKQDLQYSQYQLHGRYVQSWDLHMQSQLRHYLNAPFGAEFLACLAIPGGQRLQISVFLALMTTMSGPDKLRLALQAIDDSALRIDPQKNHQMLVKGFLPPSSHPLPEDYREMISHFLNDPIRAMDLHVGTESYTKLAICFSMSFAKILSTKNLRHQSYTYEIDNLPFLLSMASESEILFHQLTIIRDIWALDNRGSALSGQRRAAYTALMTYLSKNKTPSDSGHVDGSDASWFKDPSELQAKKKPGIMRYLREKFSYS
ncbi:hypothetical protein B0H34DRAFT_673507 [Crassisporium funariophilum]|nr:hypothetical protein B0H34DRAFT_673507 [Crassisporium funariophilum]